MIHDRCQRRGFTVRTPKFERAFKPDHDFLCLVAFRTNAMTASSCRDDLSLGVWQSWLINHWISHAATDPNLETLLLRHWFLFYDLFVFSFIASVLQTMTVFIITSKHFTYHMLQLMFLTEEEMLVSWLYREDRDRRRRFLFVWHNVIKAVWLEMTSFLLRLSRRCMPKRRRKVAFNSETAKLRWHGFCINAFWSGVGYIFCCCLFSSQTLAQYDFFCLGSH